MLRFVLIVYLVLQNVYCNEPHCSRFHYDDQLLDKMIRMEVKVEALEKEILKTNTQVLESLNELKQERDAIKADKIKLEKEFSELKQKILSESDSIRDTLSTPTVSFKARQPADISLETGQTLVFNNIMMDNGGGYDNVTGIFTVPVGGTYLFTLHLCLYSSNHIHYGIISDNEIQTSGHFYEDSSDCCFTADAIIVLKPGQKVWIKCLYGYTSNALYEYNSSANNRWNTFSGVLIHK